MLGIADSMENEELIAPDEEIKLPSKPQKNLITSFFKQKDQSKDARQKSQDLFGYINKSKSSEKKEKIVCEDQMNKSLEDFQEPPKECAFAKSRSHKKGKPKSVSNKHEKMAENGSFIAECVTDRGSTKQSQSHSTTEDISYEDFLKLNCVKREDKVESNPSTKTIREPQVENGMNIPRPEKMDLEISYEDFLKSCSKEVSATVTVEYDDVEMGGVDEYAGEKGFTKSESGVDLAPKPTSHKSPRRGEINLRITSLGIEDNHCSKDEATNANGKDCKGTSSESAEDAETVKLKRGNLQSRHSTTDGNITSDVQGILKAQSNGKKMTVESQVDAVEKNVSENSQKLSECPKDMEDNDQPDVSESEVPCKAEKSEEKQKQRGITMFFKKVDASEVKKMRKGDSSIITTKAVVHHLPARCLDDPAQASAIPIAGKRRSSNVAVEEKDFDLSITQLGSEVIEVPEKKRRSKEMKVETPEAPETRSDDIGTKVVSDRESEQPSEGDTSSPEGKAINIINGCLSTEILTKLDCTNGVVSKLEKRSSPEKVMAMKIVNELQSGESTENGIKNDGHEDVVFIEEQKSLPEYVQKKREEIKARNAACIASLDEVKVVTIGNRKQATLSFGSKGLVMSKQATPEPSKQTKKENSAPPSPLRKQEVGKCTETVIRPKRRSRSQVNYSEDEVKMIEIVNMGLEKNHSEPLTDRDHSRHSKTKNVIEKRIASTPNHVAQNTSEARARKVLNSVFESYLEMTPPGPKRRATIKLKFKRLKNPSSDEDFLSPKNKERQRKVNQAQKLLTKAKLVQPKKSPVRRVTKSSLKKGQTKKMSAKSAQCANPHAACEEVTRRRSQRSSARNAKAAISESLLEKKPKLRKPRSVGAREERKEEKNSKPTKKTPKRQTNEKLHMSPKKAEVPLASIFCKKKNATAAIVISDEEPEVVDPETMRIRKQFLMSGVPSTLRRQQVVSTAITGDCDHAPFPTHSHIKQEVTNNYGTLSPWKLPAVSLNLRKNLDQNISTEVKHWIPGTLLDCEQERPQIISQDKYAKPHPCVTEETLTYLLGEISASNPAYPVRRTFKQLQQRSHGGGKVDNKSNDATERADVQDNPAKGKKRKKPERETTPENPCRQSKRQRASMEGDPPHRSLRRSRRSEAMQEEKLYVFGDVAADPIAETSDQQSVSTPKDTTDAMKEDTDTVVQDLLWTEKYEPVTGAEVLGNAGCVKRLKTWLVEWKQRTDLELKRARKQLVKQAKRAGKSKEDIKKEIRKKLGSEWWADDESDFELGSEDDSDYEEEDNGLCNSTLLMGPHGVGKTALIYALAKELGYKVFEVNASSRRSGKQMLTQLQEATQSHQVSKKNLDSMFTTSMASDEISSQAPGKQKKKIPTAFANLFGKAKPKAEVKPPKATKVAMKQGKDTRKDKNLKEIDSDKKKRATGEASADDVSKKGLDLSSTSLVLFEEVDVIFEEDKGFWAAIQTFMSTTKRPIVLTTSSEMASRLVEGQHEEITLRMPPLRFKRGKRQYINMATHLQLICLAENVRTSFHDLHCLVEFHRGDLRQCLLTLQFWAQSNPSTAATHVPVMYRANFLSRYTAGQQPVQTFAEATLMSPSRSLATSNMAHDSSSDFELTPKAKRRRCVRNAIEDESSMDSIQNSPCANRFTTLLTEDSQGVESPLKQTNQQLDDGLVPAPDNLLFPPLHRACLEMFSLTDFLSSGMLSYLQEGVCGERVLSTDILTHYSHYGFNILYANLPVLLGLPCTPPVRRPSAAVLGGQKKTRLRIKHATELFSSDNESDNEGFVQLKSKLHSKDVPAQMLNFSANELAETRIPVQSLEKKRMSAEDSLLLHTVSSLSDMYDTFSFVDAHLQQANEEQEGPCGASQHVWAPGKVLPGLTDESANFLQSESVDKSLCAQAACCTQLAGVARCREQLHECLTHIEVINPDQREAVREKLIIPHEGTALRLSSEFSVYQNQEARQWKAYQYICSVLPPTVQLSKQVVSTDYIPTLQTICRSEQLRKASNTKRRFLHYLDSISLGVTRKQHVLDALCSSFV